MSYIDDPGDNEGWGAGEDMKISETAWWFQVWFYGMCALGGGVLLLLVLAFVGLLH